MKPRYSNSLILIWQVADLEAKRLQAGFLEPAHLLLGLCKAVDLDLTSLVPANLPDGKGILGELLREIARLQEVFQQAGFDAMRFRRCYRAVLPEGSAGLNSNAGRLHRTDAARDIFSQAEQLAMLGQQAVLPFHLLCAVLEEEDLVRDETMIKAGTKRRRLLACAKRLLFAPPQRLDTSGAEANENIWN